MVPTVRARGRPPRRPPTVPNGSRSARDDVYGYRRRHHHRRGDLEHGHVGLDRDPESSMTDDDATTGSIEPPLAPGDAVVSMP
ncbi:MAG: hypothetical protein AAGA54_06755 [Myxococcota bacterium]